MRKTVSSVRQWNWPALLGWLVFALALTGFDQWTKNWIQHRLITGDVDRITDFFNLVVAYNSGAAFSFLADAGGWQRPLFAGLAIVVSLVICVIIAPANFFVWVLLWFFPARSATPGTDSLSV